MQYKSLKKDVAIRKGRFSLRIILLAGLFVGTFDIVAVIIQILVNERQPIRMLQFIASGVFGKSAFSGGSSYGLYGLLFHYCIALAWTWLYFRAYPAVPFLQKQRLIAAAVFGSLIWVTMTQVVLPLSNTPPFPFKFWEAAVQWLMIFVTISLPLAFATHWYSRRWRVEGNHDVPGDDNSI